MRTNTCGGALKIFRRGKRATSQSSPGLPQALAQFIAPRFSTVSSGNLASALRCMGPIPCDHRKLTNWNKPCIQMSQRHASPSHSFRLLEELHKKLAAVTTSLLVHKLHGPPQSRHQADMHNATAVQLTFGLASEGPSWQSEPATCSHVSLVQDTNACSNSSTPHQLIASCCMNIQPGSPLTV
jgi:hypothetical protein